jgi:cytochrome c-type biogenesis protein CcmF
MAWLGYYLLLAAFVVGAYAAAISVAGARRRSRPLIESGTGALYLVMAIMLAASSLIVHAFVTGDYSIKYVQRYSDSTLPLFYKLASYWGGLDGSIMFWVTLLSIFGSCAVWVNRERHRELIPYVVAVLSVVQTFFLLLMILHNNPFQQFLTETHADGVGLSPLLQNFYMVIHPPTMYLGFVGLTIPFAFGMAALITGHLDDSWLVAVRRWTMISWLLLSLGLALGMIWAYEELGWGGYWMWDPVENAALLPWFPATAFLHSVMVQERRGMLRVWNVCLIITTFFLTIFGTFLTRSGIVQSVHSFGDNPELARLFIIFMATLVVVSFGLVIYRLPLLRSRNELDSWASREAAFLLNNWILLFCAFFVIFATMFPTLSEAVTGWYSGGPGHRITVGPPFFNKWIVPIGLVLLLLTGIGPLLAWRKSTLANMREQFVWPTIAMLVVGGVVVAMGVRVWSSGLCFAFSGFVMGTIAQEFWRGARVRQQTTGTDVFTALVGLVGRNKRRYGGYVVHVAIVLMFLGFAGEGFKQTNTVLLTPGMDVTVGAYTVRLDAVRESRDERKQAITAYTTVFKGGDELTTMHPARWFFHTHQSEPTSEVAIRRSFADDLYIVMPQFDLGRQEAHLEVVVNPLVNWVWLGFGLMALGTLIALLPDTAFAFAGARVPASAATTTMLLLALAMAPGVAFAQAVPKFTDQEVAARRDIMCTCGCRRSLEKCGMTNCGGEAAQMAAIRRYIAEGKSHDEILAAFVRDGGEHMLMAPIDRGFNRLAWLFPYALAAAGLVTIIVNARRWSHRPALAPSGAVAATDPALDARLDDELRSLD